MIPTKRHKIPIDTKKCRVMVHLGTRTAYVPMTEAGNVAVGLEIRAFPGDFTQEADLVRGVCGAHGGYETAEVCDVRRIRRGRGLRGRPGKRVYRVFPGRPYLEPSVSTLTNGRPQPRTRGNGAGRRNKGRNLSWRNGLLQKNPELDYGMQYYART